MKKLLLLLSCLVFMVEPMQAGFLSGTYGKIKSNQITGVIRLHCKGLDAIDDRCVSTKDDVITIEWIDDEFATVTSQTYGHSVKFIKNQCRAYEVYGNGYTSLYKNRIDCACGYSREERIGEYPYFMVRYQNKIYQFRILSAEAYNPKTSTWERYVPSSDEAENDELLWSLRWVIGTLDPDYVPPIRIKIEGRKSVWDF